METIIEACKALDYSWLPQSIEGFTLVTSTESDYTTLSNRISAGEDVLKVPIFDYTVHIEMPLFSFVDISFVRADLESFWTGLQERCVKGLTNMLIEPSNNFTFTYRRRGILEWDFSQVMPEELEGFVRDIDPAHAIRMINGSFIIGEYRKMDECTGLLLYYNELRDEYFAELRYKSYPEIDHHLDAKHLDDLAVLLREHLGAILKGLNDRVD